MGPTDIPFGMAHLVVFATFLLLAVVPGAENEAMTMRPAEHIVQIDNDEVRVTQWRLAPGTATGPHTHGMDYVIVPVTPGEMTIIAPSGEVSQARLAAGVSYFRKAGVEHDVQNRSADEIVFLEIELKA